MNPNTDGLYVRYLSVLIVLLCAAFLPAKAQLTADFSTDKIGGCAPLTVQFNNLTRGASANATFFWDMGNGNTSINRNVSATYLTEKTYTVTLTVTDGSARSVKTMQIVVSRKPIADFDVSAPHGCIPFTPTITSKSTTADGTLTSFVWEFGDGTTQTTSSPSVAHTYTTPMKPVITLTAVNNYGCAAIVQKQGLTDVLPALTAGFSVDKPILCKVDDPISFTNTSAGPGNLTYQWNFGDGQSATTKNATHVYGKAGEYTATLTTKNDKGCTHSFTLPGVINVAAYKLDITVPTILCTNPGYHTFTASTYPGTYSVQWEFSNGVNNYGNYISQSITTAGDYSVKAKATFGTCPAEVTKSFKVNASPQLNDFEITDPPKCGTPATLQLKDNSTWAAKWSWSVYSYYSGSITVPATKTASVNLTTDDYYTVSLLATDANGCTASTSKQLSVYKPVVTIQTSNSTSTDGYLTSCGSFSASFFAAINTGTITSWKWDAGAAGKSTAESPSFTFTNAGRYTVALEYETSLGCKGTTSVTAIVNSGPTIGITGPQSVCGDNEATFTSTGTTGGVNASYYWSANKTYGGSGGYSAYLTGSSTTGRFTDTGWYNIRLVVYNNGNTNYCSNERTMTKFIQVLPPFKGEISVVNNCTDNKGELTFTEYSRYTEKWVWDFGDGESMTYTKATKPAEVKHVYKNSGRYIASLTISAGSCSFTVSKDVIVLLDPKISFTNDATVCGDRNASFRNTGSTIVSEYFWAFNSSTSGASATGASPYIRFSDTGWYSGKLTLRVNNCRYEGSEMPKVIKVLPPYPGFIYPQLTCNADRGEVIFTETSKGAENWEWTFGDGGKTSYNLSNKQTITKHAYTRTGSYNVVLKVTTGGCTFDMTTNVTVLMKQKPQLSAIQTAVCVDDPLKITLQGFEKNPRGQYPNGPDYGTPQVQYEDGTFFTGNQESTVPRQYPYTPGPWETVYTANLHSLSRERKQIRMISAPYGFWDYANCPDTSNYVTMRIDGPTTVIKITKNNVCNKQPVVFEDLSTVPAGNSIVNRRWSFGDGQTQTGASIKNPIEHYYSNLGSYPVTLTVTDNNGCNATTTATAVMAGPRAAFSISPTPATNKNTVYFYNNTWDLTSGTQYEWRFSYDGLKTTDYTPVPRTYKKGGPATDEVMLIAYNTTSGCRDTAIQYLPVVNVNNAFTMNKRLLDGGCAPALVQFTNISYNYNNFKWDFGDGTILEDPYGSIRTPGHIYEKPGTYKVTLYGIGIGNSRDTTVDSVIIKPLAFASNVKANLKEACTAQPVNLSADIKNNTDITWDYGDGVLAKANAANITYTYSSGGIFRPAITVKNEDGCPAAAELNYQILIDSLNLKLSPQPSKICDAATVNFNPVVKNLGAERLGRSLTYTWNFGLPGTPGNTSSDPKPTYYYDKIGTYKPSLRVQTPAGCDQTVTADIRVIKTPVLQLTAPDEACAQSDVSFLATSDPEAGVNFNWNFKNGQTSNALLPPKVNYNTPGNYLVELKADNDGCIRIVDHPIVIHKLPAVNPLRDTTLVFGTPLPLRASGSSDIVKWSWSPPANLDCANCAVTIAQPKASGHYQVTAYNEHGCSASAGMNVKLVCAETPIFIPNTFTPNKDGRNDLFYPRGKGVKVVKYFRIYNRLGEMIFERRDFALNDPAQGWDGTYMGRPLTNSVFTYASEMICDAGEAFLLKGTIMLMH